MTGFVLAEGTHQMPGRSWISIGRYEDGILRQLNRDHDRDRDCDLKIARSGQQMVTALDSLSKSELADNLEKNVRHQISTFQTLRGNIVFCPGEEYI
jgi:hypothetical protein